MKETLIDIQDLCIQFQTSAGTVHAVDHVSFDIKKGEVFYGLRDIDICKIFSQQRGYQFFGTRARNQVNFAFVRFWQI